MHHGLRGRWTPLCKTHGRKLKFFKTIQPTPHCLNQLLTIFRCCFVLHGVQDIIVKGQKINRDYIFASVVLLYTCQKGLRKEEPRNPKGGWSSLVIPVLQIWYVTARKLHMTNKHTYTYRVGSFL